MYKRAPSPGLGPLGWLVGLAGYGCVRQLRSRYIDRLGGDIEDPEHAIRCVTHGDLYDPINGEDVSTDGSR